MSNLVFTPKWNTSINQVESTEEIRGGVDGVANLATKQLAENIFYLRDLHNESLIYVNGYTNNISEIQSIATTGLSTSNTKLEANNVKLNNVNAILATNVASVTSINTNTTQKLNKINAEYSIKVNSKFEIEGIKNNIDNIVKPFSILGSKLNIAYGNTSEPLMDEYSTTYINNGKTVNPGAYIKPKFIKNGSIGTNHLSENLDIIAPNITNCNINIKNSFIIDGSTGNVTITNGTYSGNLDASKIIGKLPTGAYSSPGYTVFFIPQDGGATPLFPSNFTADRRKYKTFIPSKGSILYQSNVIGDRLFGYMFEMRISCVTPQIINQYLVHYDDYFGIFINGTRVDWGNLSGAYAIGSGQKAITLPAGETLLQIVVNNNRGGDSAIVLIGDFIDEDKIKFVS